MSTASVQSLAQDFAYLRALAEKEPRDSDDLVNNLKEIYRAVFFVDLGGYDLAEVRPLAPRLMQEIFELRLRIRGRIPAWVSRGIFVAEAQAALRDAFRASRYAGDMLGEIHTGHPRLAPGQATYAALSGAAPNLQVNPAYAGEPLELRPGDVVLQRGTLHNSAAIARIGDVDSQFSHIAIVARAPTGELVMVEALIEEGALVTPIGRALAHHLGRAILFRHRDQALAARAAERIHAHIAKSLEPPGRRILYDFAMELDGYRELYCSKLIRLAYEMGSDGRVKLPPFATRLDMRNRDFVDRIGVTARTTFAPGDLELDPDFDVVAEWRDFRVTSELRLKDMVMTRLFAWMDDYGYRFRPDFVILLISVLGRLSARLSRRVQEVIAEVVAKVPPNMSRSAIGAVAMLHKTAEPIYQELARLEDETIRNTGRQLHPREVFDELERIRRRQGNRIGYLAR